MLTEFRVKAGMQWWKKYSNVNFETKWGSEKNSLSFSWKVIYIKNEKKQGPTEIWTRIAGFKVQSANHYTMGPFLENLAILVELYVHDLLLHTELSFVWTIANTNCSKMTQ